MDLITIRLDRTMVERLRVLARTEAVRRDENVTWASLVHESIEDRLTAAERDGVVVSLPTSSRSSMR